jgi:hypothetical protein
MEQRNELREKRNDAVGRAAVVVIGVAFGLAIVIAIVVSLAQAG